MRQWLALAAACRMGMARAAAEPAVIASQMAVYWAFLLSLAAVLNAVPAADLARLHLTAHRLIWYLIVSEVLLSFSAYEPLRLQDEIRDGRLEVALLRPVDYRLLYVAEWYGYALVLTLGIGVFSFGLGWWYTGSFIWSLPLLLALGASGLIGGLIMVIANFVVGASALWVGDAWPVYWIWQKALFLLGGLYWPLVFYPAWFERLARLSPFSAMMATPSDLAFGLGPEFVPRAALQCLWLAAFVLASRWAGGRVRRFFQVHGGAA